MSGEPAESDPRREDAALEGYRLSPQQERLWGLLPETGGPGACLEVRIEGDLDRPRLRRAVEVVTERHDILRTGFVRLEGSDLPFQVVAEDAEPGWTSVDLSALGRHDRSRVAAALAGSETTSRGPRRGLASLEARLLCLGDEHRLVLAMPALCADARSLECLFREVVEAYSSPRDLAPHERPMPYAQFSEWQQQLLELDEAAEEREFWRSRDFGPLLGMQLPFQKPSRPNLEVRPDEVEIELPPNFGAAVEAMARSLGVTTADLVLAVWLVQLSRLTGGASVGVARQSSGRPYEELENALGLFEKHLPLQVRPAERDPFRAFLEQMRAEVEETEGWLEYFDWRQLLPRGGGSRPLPLGFEVLRRAAPRRHGDLVFSSARQETSTERCRLALRLYEGEERLQIGLRFDPRAFERHDLERALLGLTTGLGQVLRDPALALGRVSFLHAAERHQVLHGFQSTRCYFPGETAVHRAIEARCAEHPDRVAVQLGERSLSYGELHRLSNRIARRLVRLGAGPETLVGVYMERSPELVAVLLAVFKAGAAYLPLDPEYPAERLELMVEDSRLGLLVSTEELRPTAPAGGVAMLVLDADLAGIADEPAGNLPPPAVPSDLAYAIYTSGSTGRPKAALNGHRALYNRLAWMQQRFALEAGEPVLHKTPFSFDVSVWEIFWPLAAGARVVLARPAGQRDLDYLIELIEDEAVTTVHFV
ncbi:MAG: AMP-binding protein, partial [Acidobacteria bacterium]|nr:AMP-binding protein [Acidobacteriota bacterium]